MCPSSWLNCCVNNKFQILCHEITYHTELICVNMINKQVGSKNAIVRHQVFELSFELNNDTTSANCLSSKASSDLDTAAPLLDLNSFAVDTTTHHQDCIEVQEGSSSHHMDIDSMSIWPAASGSSSYQLSNISSITSTTGAPDLELTLAAPKTAAQNNPPPPPASILIMGPISVIWLAYEET